MLKNKILHINCNYIGTTLHQAMIEKLEKLGYDNRVFVPTYNKNLAVLKVNSNVKVCECFKKWDRILFDYKQFKIYKAIQSEYKIDSFNLIHAYTLFTDGNCARKLSKKYNIPYVVAIRNTDVNDFFKLMPHLRNRGIKIMLDAKAIFFLSPIYKEQVLNKYIPFKYQKEIENKSYIIPNGIDDFWILNKRVAQNSIRNRLNIKLLYVGGINKNKNIIAIQKAMKILRSQKILTTLTIVGKVYDEKLFKKIIKDSNTKYYSAIPKEKLIEFYKISDIFIMASHTETFGLVYAEAISQGLPVLYTAGQGFDGQFSEGVVGYHINDKDINTIVVAIKNIIENYESKFNDISDYSNKFNWNIICEKYKEIYESIKK